MLTLARDVAGTWRARIVAGVVLLTALAGLANPLTNHLGYASSLVAAVACSWMSAMLAAGLPGVLRARKREADGGTIIAVGSLAAVALVLIAVLVAGVGGVLTAPCAPGGGLAFFALIALPGAVYSALIGLACGAVIARPWRATVLAGTVLPGSIIASLVRFYRTPAIFAYDPFYGFFPGAYYDETIRLSSTLVTYRFGTVGAIVAVACAIAAMWDAPSARLKIHHARARVPLTLASVAGLALAVGVYVAGASLGHRSDADDIARALGGRVTGPRCTVLYARSIAARDARSTLDDCQFRIGQLERFFGVRVTTPITVFLFADAAQKQLLMGAGDTYIAKPWRHEVYLQFATFPHPVLKHELAHVVAGEMAGGPFQVSVSGGVIPLTALIEGAAVAAAWEGEGDSTPHQWSRAMLEAGLAPSMRALMGIGFFTHASGTAYTAAGSFSRWLIERYGTAKYQRVYRDGDFDAAYGKSIDALEREWHAFLHTVPVPERLLARARTRFRRAALTARVCPHETAELYERSVARLTVGDIAGARDGLQTVVRNDPTDVHARVSLAETSVRAGDVTGALALADSATRDLGPAAGARLRARIGDLAWRWQDADRARTVYAPIDVELFDEDEARTLEVKRWALGLIAPAAALEYADGVRELLIGRGDLDPDPLAAVVALTTRVRGSALDPPAAYLVARQEQSHERYAEAAAMLGAVDLGALPTARVRAEALRLRGVALLMSGHAAEALEIFAQLGADTTRPQGARETALDWADRARHIMR